MGFWGRVCFGMLCGFWVFLFFFSWVSLFILVVYIGALHAFLNRRLITYKKNNFLSAKLLFFSSFSTIYLCHHFTWWWLCIWHDCFLFEQKNYLDVYRFESWGSSMIPAYVFGQQVCYWSSHLELNLSFPIGIDYCCIILLYIQSAISLFSHATAYILSVRWIILLAYNSLDSFLLIDMSSMRHAWTWKCSCFTHSIKYFYGLQRCLTRF